MLRIASETNSGANEVKLLSLIENSKVPSGGAVLPRCPINKMLKVVHVPPVLSFIDTSVFV